MEKEESQEEPEIELKFNSLDMNLVKSNIPGYPSEKLCEMIVCDRYFGMGQGISVLCMEELAKRRVAGEIFPFEEKIEEKQKSLPPLNFEVPDIRTILTQAIGKKR
jgi:hypothetical protein